MIAGYSLIAIALLAFAGIASTGVQRITAEQKAHLDPLELELRQRAYSMAYQIFTAVAALAALYFMMAMDASKKLMLWVPTTGDHWSGILWAILLMAFVLPTACLAWRMPLTEDDAES